MTEHQTSLILQPNQTVEATNMEFALPVLVLSQNTMGQEQGMS